MEFFKPQPDRNSCPWLATGCDDRWHYLSVRYEAKHQSSGLKTA
jgi:hypothetical protein